MQPGREIGQILRQLTELVLEDPDQNTREQLLTHARLLAVLEQS